MVDYDMEGNIAKLGKATDEQVFRVFGAPQHDDGRSEFVWCRFANGDLALVVFPMGDTYFNLEGEVPV